MKIERIDEFATRVKPYSGKITYETNCTETTQEEWDELMKGGKPYPYSNLVNLIRKYYPKMYNELALNYHNPWSDDTYETKTHLILTHSAIEYFFRKDGAVNECIHPMTTSIKNLEDGEYMGYRYGYMFELENGFKFETESGVRCSRKFAPLKKYRVVKGEIYEM